MLTVTSTAASVAARVASRAQAFYVVLSWRPRDEAYVRSGLTLCSDASVEAAFVPRRVGLDICSWESCKLVSAEARSFCIGQRRFAGNSLKRLTAPSAARVAGGSRQYAREPAVRR